MSAATTRITRPDAVDVSCRLPVLKLTLGALAWLLFGLVFAVGAGLAFQQPRFAVCEYITPGKLAAVARTALVYGFASQAGLAVTIWVLARVGEAPVKTGLAVAAGSVFWNIGVTAGVVGILCGEQSGIPYFDFPGYAGGILLAAYALMGVSTLSSFGVGARRPLQWSQWFILAAMLWFPWLLSTAQIFLVWFPVRGVLQAVIGGWYAQGLLWGWLTPLTLGALFYLLPELTGKPLPRRSFAVLGFWGLLLLAGWNGAGPLIGGPVPAWIASIGVVAGTLLFLPVVLVSLNLFIRGGFGLFSGQPALQLVRLSAFCFTLGGVSTALTSLRCANRVLHFTLFPLALNELWILGFVGLGLLAAFYVILPRLIGFAWNQTLLAFAHVGLSLAGLGLTFLAYAVGGWIQGHQLDGASNPLMAVNAGLAKFLALHTLGLAVFLLGQLAFVGHLACVGIRHFPMVKSFVISLITPDVAVNAGLAASNSATK